MVFARVRNRCSRWPAAVSVRTKETFHDAVDVSVLNRIIEAYIIDKTGLDLYGHTVTAEFTAFMRPAGRFGSSPLPGREDSPTLQKRSYQASRNGITAQPGSYGKQETVKQNTITGSAREQLNCSNEWPNGSA